MAGRGALLALLLIAGWTGAVSAQVGGEPGALRGRVTDERGAPVAGAQVVAERGGEVRSAVTGTDGGFELAPLPAGRYALRAQAAGHRPAGRSGVTVAAGAVASASLVLPSEPVALSGVVVTATRTATPVSAVPGSVSVLTGEEIAAQAGLNRNLGDLLGKLVPGFGAGGESNSLWGQTLRGRSLSVLIDGVPQSTARNVSRDLSTIDPAAIERVEVLRGATAIYGDGATGGVINIITRTPGTGAPRMTTTLGTDLSVRRPGESLGGSLAQSLAARHGDLDYTFSTSFARTGGFFDAEGDRIVPDPTGQGGLSDTDSWNVFGKVGYQLGAQRLQLSVNHFDSRQQTRFTVDPAVAKLPAGEAKSRPREGMQLEDPQGTVNTVVNLDYRNPDVLGSHLHGQLYFRDYLTRFAPFDGRRFKGYRAVIQSYLDSRKAGGRLELETALPGPGAPTLFWGADYTVEETSQPVGILDGAAYDQSGGLVFHRIGEKVWVPPMEPKSLGLFAQLAWDPTDRLTLRGGVRHERVRMYVDDFTTLAGDAVTGGALDFDPVLLNLGAVLDVTEAVGLFGNYSQGFSLMDVGLFLRGAPAGFRVGSKALEPQKVNHYEAGVRTTSGWVESSVAGFYNQSDLGTSSAGLELNVVRAPERVYGVEATLDLRPASRWNVGGTFSWIEGEFDPEQDGSFRALNSWRIQPMKLTGHVEHGAGSRWRNRLQLLHSGSRDRAWVERPDTTRVGFGERPVRSYTVLDWMSSLELGRGTLQLGVQNLLNRHYFSVASQLMRSGNNTSYTPARGATLSVGYSVTY